MGQLRDTCRQKTYGLVHQSILRQVGVDVPIITVQPRKLIEGLSRTIPSIPLWKGRRAVRETLREIWRHDLRRMREQARSPSGKPKIGICGEIYTVLEPAANTNLIQRLREEGAYVHNAHLPEPVSA